MIAHKVPIFTSNLSLCQTLPIRYQCQALPGGSLVPMLAACIAFMKWFCML